MIGALLRGLGFVALLLASLAAAAWLGHQFELHGVALVAWSTGWLLGLRTSKARRHEHGGLLVLSLLMMGVAGLAVRWVVSEYPQAAAWVNVHWGMALAWAGLAIPPTAAGAVTFLNGVALAAWAITKFVLLKLIGWQPAGAAVSDAVSSVAYSRREQVWRLKPWWLWARLLGWLLLALGVGLTAWQAWDVRDPGFAGWVRLLPVLIIAVGIEWLQWLSGTVDKQAEPEFGGRALGADQLSAIFEDLWVRYRQVWPRHWRAAGNRTPEFPSDG